MYGAEVWGYEKDEIIESLHLEYCKYLLKVKKCTPNCIVYGELGRVPMSVNIKARMIGFWKRIVTGKKEKISRTLYEMLYKLDSSNVYHSKWLNCIKDILFECGFHDAWNNQFVDMNCQISKNIKQHYHNFFVNKWKDEVYNSPKCLNYRIYKTEFGFENYLTILPFDLRISLCKFRCGTHRLPIECGRFFSIDRSERLCDLCNKNVIGDEFHYIFECSYFNAERLKYLPANICSAKNVLSFTVLMNSKDKFVLVGLAKFCKIVMSIFK